MAENLEIKKLLSEYKKTSTGRIDFSKSSSNVLLPNLCEVQLNSFKWFIDKGIDEAFNDAFPISSNVDTRGRIVESDRVMKLEFIKSKWGEPKNDYFECKLSNITYSAPLYCRLKLTITDGTIQEDDVFMGDFPLMTPSGTFIINGSEKCIASQLIRSPGAYVSRKADEITVKKVGSDRGEISVAYGSDIIPTHGFWLEYLTDTRDYLSVRIDKQKKIPALVLLRSIGLVSDSDQEYENIRANENDDKTIPVTGLKGLFGDCDLLNWAIEKNHVNETKSVAERNREAIKYIYNRLRPGEPYNPEQASTILRQRFFENEHYNLGRAGRFKIKEKLAIYNRLPNQVLAEDLISKDGEVVFSSGTRLTVDDVLKLQKEKFFEKNDHHSKRLSCNADLDTHSTVNIVKVISPEDANKTVNIIGCDLTHDLYHITVSDIVASLSYMLNLVDGVGEIDDTDHLGNKRVRCVGELIQEKFRNGLIKMKKSIYDKMTVNEYNQVTISSLINTKSLLAVVLQFFNSDSLCQFMDQTNPLAELTNKRRLSALGRGGLSKDRANDEVRDVHPTHYGRICPIETPEGQNIGLISNLSCYAKINEFGFIQTPYRPVNNRVIDNDPKHVVWFSANDERNHKIAQANVHVEDNKIVDDIVSVRFNSEYISVPTEEVDYIDASPKQIVSVAAACIPFLENDDGKRALMGSNMQRQALPLLQPEAPFVGTGLEDKIASDSGSAVICLASGKVTYVDGNKIVVLEDKSSQEKEYELRKFIRSNKRTCINQVPIVKVGDKVKEGQIIADGPSMDKGELALGHNVLIAFATWHGYNYEDAVLISNRCITEDLFTNLIIEVYSIQRRKTKLGDEEFTRDIPNVPDSKKTFLDERGIIIPGAEVKEGDILVGKTTPKGETAESNNDHLLKAIFSTKSDEDRDTSLRVPHGGEGIILSVRRFSRANGDELPSADILENIDVYVIQKRKIQVGDKMSGRHGNKGVISKVLPVEDMPFMPDGTPIDICLSPMGVPSRMNIGQVLEVQLGYACKKLGIKVSTPVFDGASRAEIQKFMDVANIEKDGKTVLYDGQTGERFDSRIAVGVMYMIKLDHMVEDKLHARAVGPYSLITQQPLGGKAQRGGQRFGEMEVWALEAYGAAYTLQEMLTIKSDDMIGRNKTYEAIIRGKSIPRPNMPESTRVLIKELQGLGINVDLRKSDNSFINIDTISEQAEYQSRRIKSEIRTFDTRKEKDGSDEEFVSFDDEEFDSSIYNQNGNSDMDEEE